MLSRKDPRKGRKRRVRKMLLLHRTNSQKSTTLFRPNTSWSLQFLLLRFHKIPPPWENSHQKLRRRSRNNNQECRCCPGIPPLLWKTFRLAGSRVSWLAWMQTLPGPMGVLQIGRQMMMPLTNP